MTIRTIGGGTWPNNGEEHHIETLLNRVTGPGGVLTVLHHHIVVDPWQRTAPSNDNLGLYGKIRGGWPSQSIPAMPDMGIHIRFYYPDPIEPGPIERARQVAHMLRNWRGAFATGVSREGDTLYALRNVDLSTDPYVLVSAYNEDNLEAGILRGLTPTAEHYRAWAERELAFFRELDRLLPERRCLWAASAPAPGHDAYPDDPDSEYAVIQATGLYDYTDVVQVHTYGERHKYGGVSVDGAERHWYALRPLRPVGYRGSAVGADPRRPADRGGVIRQFGSRYRYLVSEWNTFFCDQHGPVETAQTIADHQYIMRSLAVTPGVIGACSFIWHSGREHAANIIGDNEGLRDWYEHAQTPLPLNTQQWPTARWHQKSPPVPQPEPPPMPTPTFNTNPTRRAIVEGGAINQQAKLRKLVFASDEITVPGPTGGNIVFATLLDPATGQAYLAVWSPGFGGAGLSPLA